MRSRRRKWCEASAPVWVRSRRACSCGPKVEQTIAGPRSFPPRTWEKALRSDPYPRDARYRWPAASPQAFHLPRPGLPYAWAVPDPSRRALHRLHRPVGVAVALLRQSRRGRAGAGWGSPRVIARALGPVHTPTVAAALSKPARGKAAGINRTREDGWTRSISLPSIRPGSSRRKVSWSADLRATDANASDHPGSPLCGASSESGDIALPQHRSPPARLARVP